MELDKLIKDPNDFSDIENIGSGQFGVVKLVENKKDKSRYALKQIPEESQDNDSQKLFIREVLTLFTLDHPSILRINGFSIPSSKDKSYYIFTEYMPNGNLKEVKLKEKEGAPPPGFTPTKKTICLIGIASGMRFVHRENIMHRDLKPENIFFDENFYPKIADFGLARLFEETGHITSNLGTPYFMAPELFDDDQPITMSIDVYAFGVLVLSLFDPEFKFDAPKQPKNLSQLVTHIKNGRRFVIPKGVPDSYEELIKKCWATNSKDRPTFDDVYKEIVADDSFYLKGSDKKEIRKYINMLEKNEYYEEKEEEEKCEETEAFDF